MNKACVIFVVLYTLCSPLWSQQFCAHSIGYEKGLPSLEVFDLFQDKKGYIWLGHNNGLSRYDGNNFKNFSNSNLSGKSLSLLKTDKNGRLWCINFTGQIMYVENDSLHILEAYNNLHEPNFALFDIDTLENVLYASSSKGLFRYEINTGKWKLLKPEGLKKADTRQIMISPKGEVLITTADAGCWKYKNGQFSKLNQKNDQFEQAPNVYPVPSKEIVFFDRFKKLFFKYDNGIKLLKTNFDNGELNTFSVVGNEVFMNTTAGSFRLSIVKDSVLVTTFSPEGNISDIIKDKEGSYWISTLTEGVKLIPSLDFKLYNFLDNNANSGKISCIYKSTDNYFLAGSSDGRLVKFDRNEAKVKEWILPEARAIISIEKDILGNGYYLSAGYIYYLNNDGTLIQLSKVPLNIKSFKIWNKLMLASSPVGLTVYGDDNESGTIKELLKTNKSQKNLQSLLINGKECTGITLGEVARCRSVLIEEKENRIWACYANGLMLYSRNGAEFIRADNSRIYAGKIISDGETIFVATVEKGVLALKNKVVVSKFDAQDGLPDDYVISIKIHNNRLWILTSTGIVSCRKDFSDKKVYTKEDGFIAKDPTDFVITEGKIWVSCGQGIISFPQDAPAVNMNPPMVYLSKVMVNDKATEKLDGLELDPNENNIQIDLLGFPYRSSQKFHYLYTLEKMGEQKKWHNAASTENNLKFFSLGPGNYMFEAIAVNEDGIQSSRPVRFSFTIRKPFYLRTWFLIMSISLLTGFFFIIMIIRINIVRKKAKAEMEKAMLEKNLTEAQLAAIRAQMNPHFLFNALSSVQSMFLKNDQKRANENLSRFSKLMRIILDMSNRQEVSLEEEIQMLRLYIELEINRFDNTIQYFIEVDPLLETDNCMIPPLVVQPFVENVFKHAFAGKSGEKILSLRFKRQDANLVVIIEDNGWGMDYTQKLKEIRKNEFKSFSTSATSKRIELINKTRKNPVFYRQETIYTENETGGTRIVFTFPIENTDE